MSGKYSGLKNEFNIIIEFNIAKEKRRYYWISFPAGIKICHMELVMTVYKLDLND